MNGINIKNLIERLNASTNYINTLQSKSQTDVFNLVKNKQINTAGLPTVNIYMSDSETITNQKVQSKNWTIASLYDDMILCTPTQPCLIGQILIYIDYTSTPFYSYKFGFGIFGPSPCNVNPIVNISCISVERLNINGTMDELLPINIINEAVNTILPGSGTLTSGNGLLIIGAAVIAGIILLSKK